jgi:hypothetical protein
VNEEELTLFHNQEVMICWHDKFGEKIIQESNFEEKSSKNLYPKWSEIGL